MAQPPPWTLSLTEWAILRDQLISTSQPSLSTTSALSSAALLACAGTAASAHLLTACLRAQSLPAGCRPFERDAHRSLAPNLPFLLPLFFGFHAALNIASLSSLISDYDRFQFRGHTNAIQQFNYSLLIGAGILVAWTIVSGLPPYRIGLCGPSGGVPRARSRRWSLRPTAFQLTVLGLTGLVVAFVAPLPWIVLSTAAVDRMNSLEASLLATANGVLELGAPTTDAIADALALLGRLENTADKLFASVRALAAVHLLLTVAVLFGCLAAALAVIRALRRQTDASRASRTLLPALPHAWRAPERPPPALLLHSRTEPDPELLCKLPSFVETDEHAGNACPSEEKLLLGYANTVRAHAAIALVAGLALIILNLSILTNVFRYPSKMSIGEMLILMLKFTSWVWNGCISPVLGVTNLVLALKKIKHSNSSNNNTCFRSSLISKMNTTVKTPTATKMVEDEENGGGKQGGVEERG